MSLITASSATLSHSFLLSQHRVVATRATTIMLPRRGATETVAPAHATSTAAIRHVHCDALCSRLHRRVECHPVRSSWGLSWLHIVRAVVVCTSLLPCRRVHCRGSEKLRGKRLRRSCCRRSARLRWRFEREKIRNRGLQRNGTSYW